MTGWQIAQLVLRLGLAAAFIGMGIMHFLPRSRRTMAAIIPPTLRFEGVLRPSVLVAFTGLCELAGGVGLVIPATRLVAGICMAVFLVAVFPANAYAARNRDRFGALAIPLVPRLIAQIVLIVLCLVAVI